LPYREGKRQCKHSARELKNRYVARNHHSYSSSQHFEITTCFYKKIFGYCINCREKLDPEDVERAMVTRCDPANDVVIIKNAFCHELNPTVKDNLGAKIGFDCTYPVPKPARYEKISYQPVDLSAYEIA